MTSQGKASVVIPCHNKIKYIDCMLASLYAQTWGNVELVFVNDGATDGTRERLEEWKPKFIKRGYTVVIVDQNNQGINAAVLAGLKRVTGAYVCQIDCDDELKPEYIEELAGFLENNPDYDWVCCHLEIVPDAVDEPIGTLAGKPMAEPADEDFLLQYLFLRTFIVSWVFMARTTYMRKCKVQENFVLAPSACQEPSILIPLATGGGKLKYIPKPLYRQNMCGRTDLLQDHWDRFPGYNENYVEIRTKAIERLEISESAKAHLLLLNRLAGVKLLWLWNGPFIKEANFLSALAQEAADCANKVFPVAPFLGPEQILQMGFGVFFDLLERGLFTYAPVLRKRPRRLVAVTARERAGADFAVMETSLKPHVVWDEDAEPAEAGEEAPTLFGLPYEKPKWKSLGAGDCVLILVQDESYAEQVRARLQGSGCQVFCQPDLAVLLQNPKFCYTEYSTQTKELLASPEFGRSFQEDAFLRPALEGFANYDVISADVFDTLLFRRTAKPSDVFLHLGEQLRKTREEFSMMPPETFRKLRIEAEISAKSRLLKPGVDEITIADIYEEMIRFSPDIEANIQSEMQAEKEVCFINENLASFLYFCVRVGKKTALVSDFYFPSALLGELLTSCGFSLAFINYFLVSADYGLTKVSGGLFAHLVAQSEALPERVLHIGDNPYADGIAPAERGIQTLWYGVVPNTNRGVLDMERRCFGSHLSELDVLRSLAISSVPLKWAGTSKQTWYETGAGVFGPVYSLFAQWVVQHCVTLGVHKLLAFMREGQLLGGLIEKAARNRGVNLKVVPFFVSRKTTLFLPYQTISSAVIEEIADKYGNLSLKDFFALIGLAPTKRFFAGWQTTTISNCKTRGSWSQVQEYTHSPVSLKQVNAYASQQKALFTKYLESAVQGEDFVTVDIGYIGTMQRGIQEILRSTAYKGKAHHLILLGSEGNSKTIMTGTPLTAWLGYCNPEEEDVQGVLREIFLLEALTNANIGSTIGYYEKEGAVCPALDEVDASEADMANKDIFWEGIESFQTRLFSAFKGREEALRALTTRHTSFIALLKRFLQAPLHNEAEAFGDISFSDKAGTSFMGRLCDDAHMQMFSHLATAEEIMKERERMPGLVCWMPSLLDKRWRNYHLYQYLACCYPVENPEYEKNLRGVLERMGDSGKRIAVLNTGEMGRRIVEIGWQMGLDFYVASISGTGEIVPHGYRSAALQKTVGKTDIYVFSSEAPISETVQKISALYPAGAPEIVVINSRGEEIK